MLESLSLVAENQKAVTNLSWGCKKIGDYFKRAPSLLGDLGPGKSADYGEEVIKNTETSNPDILQSKVDNFTKGEGQDLEPEDADYPSDGL